MSGATNLDDDEASGIKQVSADAISGSRVAIIVVSMLFAVLLAIYFGWIFSVTTFQHEYPKLTGIGAPPQQLEDRRYRWRYWFLVALTMMIWVPTMMIWMVKKPRQIARMDFVGIILIFFFAVTLVVLCALLVMWCTSNSEFHPQNISNSDQYCCQFFGTAPLSCRNNDMCIDFPMPVALTLNPTFVAHLAITPIIALFLGVLMFLTSAARSYGLLSAMSQ